MTEEQIISLLQVPDSIISCFHRGRGAAIYNHGSWWYFTSGYEGESFEGEEVDNALSALEMMKAFAPLDKWEEGE